MKFNELYKQVMNENTLREFKVIKDFSSTGSFFSKGEIYNGNIFEVILDSSEYINEFKKDKDNKVILPIQADMIGPIEAYKITNIEALERTAQRDMFRNGITIYVRRENIKLL
jgi:hypothetical protein